MHRLYGIPLKFDRNASGPTSRSQSFSASGPFASSGRLRSLLAISEIRAVPLLLSQMRHSVEFTINCRASEIYIEPGMNLLIVYALDERRVRPEGTKTSELAMAT
jgi:hypothetical protein